MPVVTLAHARLRSVGPRTVAHPVTSCPDGRGS